MNPTLPPRPPFRAQSRGEGEFLYGKSFTCSSRASYDEQSKINVAHFIILAFFMDGEAGSIV